MRKKGERVKRKKGEEGKVGKGVRGMQRDVRLRHITQGNGTAAVMTLAAVHVGEVVMKKTPR